MKKTLLILCSVLALALSANAQKQLREATTAEMSAGTIGLPAVVTPRRLLSVGAVTNDTTTINFISARNLPKQQQDWINGFNLENQSRGYRANLVDAWVFQSGIWGTNQTSFYGVAWTGTPAKWTNTVGARGNNTGMTVTLPLRQSVTNFTIAVTLSTPQWCLAGSGSTEPETYYMPLMLLKNTNDNSFHCLEQFYPQLNLIDSYQAGSGFVYFDGTYNKSNAVQRMAQSINQSKLGWISDTIHAVAQTMRTTWIISYSNGNYSAWRDAMPCTFPTNNLANSTSAKLSFTYKCPIVVTSAMNSIVLGYDSTWGVNRQTYGPAAGFSFSGQIYSVILYNIPAETNALDTATGICSGSPLANCAYAASWWLDNYTAAIGVEGTSVFGNGTTGVNGIRTNLMAFTLQQLVDTNTCVFSMHQAGASLQGSTNVATCLAPPVSKFVTPYLYLTQIPRGKVSLVALAHDNPRNDNDLPLDTAVSLVRQTYAPLMQQGIEIWQGMSHATGTNASANNMYPLLFKVSTNTDLYTRIANEYEFVAPGGAVDINNPALSDGSHFNGTDLGLGNFYMRQYAGLWLRKPWAYLTPPPAYPVTLSGNPAFYTNRACRNVNFTFQGGAVTGLSLNGSQYFGPTNGCSIVLRANDILAITNTSLPAAAYRPIP